MVTLRVAILDGGLHHQRVFGGKGRTFIVPTRGAAIRPEQFDIVVVPFHTDQKWLGERREELEQFVDDGGVLLVLGACDLAGSQWVPFCQITHDFTTETIPNRHSPAAKKIFAGVSDFKFHTKWHAHGGLAPRRLGTETLAEGEQGRVVMLLLRTSKGGAALVTTLDPDHHCASAVPGPGKRTTEPARRNAHRLLENLLAFTEHLAASRKVTSAKGLPEARKVFLSHNSANKELVHRIKAVLDECGYVTWLDEKSLKAGHRLKPGLREGMKDSCGAIFFVTPEFKDAGWIAKEIGYALIEKKAKRDLFVPLAIVFPVPGGRKAVVPRRIRTTFVYKTPKTEVEAVTEIVRALPLQPWPVAWRESRGKGRSDK